MTASLAALLYLVSGALFIMALRGLSSPATSRQGNIYGMVGMGIAILTRWPWPHLPAHWFGLSSSRASPLAAASALIWRAALP